MFFLNYTITGKLSGILIISLLFVSFEDLLSLLVCVFIEWKIEPDLETAARLFRRHILKNAEDKPDLVVTLDLHSCEKDRERDMLTFYKRPNIDWTSPLKLQYLRFRCR